MLSGEQHVEQNTQGVNIGCGRHWRTGYLFWSGIFWRHGAPALHRQLGGGPILGIALQQLGDTEVEQFYGSVFTYQHIGRLKVAVHDEVCMRMSHGRDHRKKELHARFNSKLMPIAVAVDVVAFDEFEDDVRGAGRRQSCVDQFCDIRVRESPKNAAFSFETLFAAAAYQRNVQEFDGDLTIETSIIAFA